MLMSRILPVTAVARMVGEHDATLLRMMHHKVDPSAGRK
jgi:hypothetical protein